MSNFTLIIYWPHTVTQTPFATRQLAMAALDDIRVTALQGMDKTLDTFVNAAVIVQNTPDETLAAVRRAKS